MPKETFDKIAAEKKERIISEAARVFAERGFAGTDVAELAQRAQVAKGSIYNYFESKDDLYLHVCRDALERSRRAVWGDVEQGWDIFRVIDHLFRAGAVFATEHPEYITIYLNVSSPGMERFAEQLTTEVERHTAERLTSLIVEGMERGIVGAAIDPRWAAFHINSLYITLLASLVSTHFNLRLQVYLGLEAEPDLAWLEGHLDEVIETICQPLRPMNE